MRPIALVMALTTALSAAAPVIAAPYRFDVTDPDATLGGQPVGTYYFFLDSMPTPTTFTPDTFTLTGMTYSTTFSNNVTFDRYAFYIDASGGGFDDFENVYIGPQLFTGTTDHPTFRLGTFAINDFVSNGSITISAVGTPAPVPAAPEPASWAMMILGLGIVGGAMRRVKVAVRFA